MPVIDDFAWSSKLGIRVILFLIYGGMHALSGLAPLFVRVASFDDRVLYMSDRADAVYYGETPSDLQIRIPEIRKFKDTMDSAWSTPRCAGGLLVMAVAWFALRRGEMWALGALTVSGLVVIPLYAVMFIPYIRAGAPVMFAHPPYLSLPVMLLAPAAIFGWRPGAGLT